MKGLKLKGKIKIEKKLDYEILFSDVRDSFRVLPVSTSLKCVEMLVSDVVNRPELNVFDLNSIIQSYECATNHLKEIKKQFTDVKPLDAGTLFSYKGAECPSCGSTQYSMVCLSHANCKCNRCGTFFFYNFLVNNQ